MTPRESPWPFTERGSEIAIFERAWRRRGCRSVAICGPAGVGKSRLADELLARAVAGGYTGARVTASAASAAVPLSAVAHLVPVGSDLSDPVALFADTARALKSSPPHRWAIVVDDLHLLDATSAALLRYLTDAGVARLIATVRTGGSAADSVEALVHGDAACRIDLAPFDRNETERLLRAALGAPLSHRTLHRLFEVSGGNALYLRELVHAALDAGSLAWHGEIWELADGSLPTTSRLSEVIRTRLAAASPAARRLLELLAVCAPVSLADAAATASTEIVAGLEDTGLVHVRQDRRRAVVALSHPLYGEALREDLSVVRRRGLLLQQIERVSARGGRRRDDALHIASWQLAAVGNADPVLLRRAAALARHAHDYEHVLALLTAIPHPDRDHDSLLLHGDALVQLGRWREADEMLARAQRAAGTEQQRTAAAMLRTWNLFWVAARTEDALGVNDAERQEVVSRAGRQVLTLNEGALLTISGRPEHGLALLEELEPEVDDARDLNGWLLAAMSKTAGLAFVGRSTEAVEWGLAAHAAHVSVDDRTLGPAHPASQLVPVIFAATDAGDLAQAVTVADRVLATLVDNDAAQTRVWAAVYRGRAEWLAGDVRTARRWYAEAITQGRAHGQIRPLFQAWGGLAATAAVLRDVDTAESALARMRSYPVMGHQAGEECLGEAWLEVARGRLSRARTVLTDAAAAAGETGHLTSEMLLLTDVARLGGAAEVADRLGGLSLRCDGAFAPARAHLATALADDDPERLLAVATELATIGAHLLAAEAATRAATGWRRAGRARRATAAAHAARTYAAHCPGARTPLLASGEATYALTAREREVVLLAVAATRSKDIADALHLSVRTVDNHLQRAYAKLGVRTRRELAELLRGPDSGPVE
ncbi:LuxR C-terminal-related transcriptional regulator [Cryptosporangium aurantiacum]|nr:LuxR family transcriptional regulator [Cryptosporangium aurantiacum]